MNTISFLAWRFDPDDGSVSFQVNDAGLDFFNTLDCIEKDEFMDVVLDVVEFIQGSGLTQTLIGKANRELALAQ